MFSAQHYDYVEHPQLKNSNDKGMYWMGQVSIGFFKLAVLSPGLMIWKKMKATSQRKKTKSNNYRHHKFFILASILPIIGLIDVMNEVQTKLAEKQTALTLTPNHIRPR